MELETCVTGYAANPFASLRPEQVYSSPNKARLAGKGAVSICAAGGTGELTQLNPPCPASQTPIPLLPFPAQLMCLSTVCHV